MTVRPSGAEDSFRWPMIRKAQAAARDAVGNTGLVCLLDPGEYGNIHPTDKRPVGERLAELAGAMLYGGGEVSPRAMGKAAEGDTLVVNLSESFRAEIQAQGKEAETLICYSMVNTLCKNTGVKKVRFFFEGEQVETVAGTIYWAGDFMYNIGLAEKGLG